MFQNVYFGSNFDSRRRTNGRSVKCPKRSTNHILLHEFLSHTKTHLSLINTQKRPFKTCRPIQNPKCLINRLTRQQNLFKPGNPLLRLTRQLNPFILQTSKRRLTRQSSRLSGLAGHRMSMSNQPSSTTVQP